MRKVLSGSYSSAETSRPSSADHSSSAGRNGGRDHDEEVALELRLAEGGRVGDLDVVSERLEQLAGEPDRLGSTRGRPGSRPRPAWSRRPIRSRPGSAPTSSVKARAGGGATKVSPG